MYVVHVYNIFMFSYNVYYIAVTQQMDNVALSLFLGDGKCRNELLSRWIVSQWIVGEMDFDGDPLNLMMIKF